MMELDKDLKIDEKHSSLKSEKINEHECKDAMTAGHPYMCTICHKTFKTSNERVLHMRTHSGEKPYTCKICEKGFTSSSYLTIHMRIHSGEKPYTCNI